jgi:hypothetical protein
MSTVSPRRTLSIKALKLFLASVMLARLMTAFLQAGTWQEHGRNMVGRNRERPPHGRLGEKAIVAFSTRTFKPFASDLRRSGDDHVAH